MPVQLPVKNESETKGVAPLVGTLSPSIVDMIPLKLVMLLASPYLAGQTCDEAIKKAHQVYKENRFTATIDILGEDARADEDCQRFAAAYKDVIDAVASLPIPCSRSSEQITVSFKPSMFSTIVPTESAPDKDRRLSEAYDRIKGVVDYALKHNIRMTMEAEDYRWADFQLDAYTSLINAGYSNVGTVLQTRLFRVKSDLKRFDERSRVRLVIGIYNEPAELAYTEKPIMKELLVDYALELAQRGTYLEIGSHDGDCINKFIKQVAIPLRLSASQFEVQHLMGVPRLELQQGLVSGKYFVQMSEEASGGIHDYLSDLARTGVMVRLYLPFGKDHVAAPYCKRRLKANPHMISYGIKNLLHLK